MQLRQFGNQNLFEILNLSSPPGMINFRRPRSRWASEAVGSRSTTTTQRMPVQTANLRTRSVWTIEWLSSAATRAACALPNPVWTTILIPAVRNQLQTTRTDDPIRDHRGGSLAVLGFLRRRNPLR